MKRILIVLGLLLFCSSFANAKERKIYETRVPSSDYLGTYAEFDYNKKTGQAWVEVSIDEDTSFDAGDPVYTHYKRVNVPGLHYDKKMVKYNEVVCAKAGFFGLKSTGNCKFKIEEKDKTTSDKVEEKDITVKLLIQQ